MEKDETKAMTVRLPTDLHTGLYQLAQSHHHSMNAEILNLIETAVAQFKASRPPS